MRNPKKESVVIAMLLSMGLMSGGTNSCPSDKIMAKKQKNLPKPNFKIPKHKRNKKTGY